MQYLTDDIEFSLPPGWMDHTVVACTPPGRTPPTISFAHVVMREFDETASEHARSVLDELRANFSGFELVSAGKPITVGEHDGVDLRYAVIDHLGRRIEQRTVVVIGHDGMAIHLTGTAHPEAGPTTVAEMEAALDLVLSMVRLPSVPPGKGPWLRTPAGQES